MRTPSRSDGRPCRRLSAGLPFVLAVLLTAEARAGAPDHEPSAEPPSNRYAFSLVPAERPAWNTFRNPGIPQSQETESASAGAKPPRKRTGRAIAEFFVLSAPSQILYWSGIFGPPQDWSYRLTWADQSKRFFTFQAWTFDSNCYFLNWMHGPIGAVYYEIARSNRLNRFESFLFTLGCSLYWEYVTEYRSAVSINDNVFTAFGGIPIGETWHVLGEYFLSRSGPIDKLIGFLNPILKYNAGRDRKLTGTPFRRPEPGGHDFRLGFGMWNGTAGASGASGLRSYLDLDARILSLPDAERPGEMSRTVSTTLFNEVSGSLLGAGGRIEESRFLCRSVYLGYVRKAFDPALDGYRFFLGLGSAFSFLQRRNVAFYDAVGIIVKDLPALKLEEPRNFRDKFSAAHICGPVFELVVRRGAFCGRLMAEAYLDFSLVNALALNAYSVDHDVSTLKTTLTYYGYYYAAGGSGYLRLEAEAGPFEFRGSVEGHAWRSIQGLDEFQEEIEDDFPLRDTRTFLRLGAGYRLGDSPLVFVLAYERIGRRGIIKDFDETESESRVSAGFQLRY